LIFAIARGGNVERTSPRGVILRSGVGGVEGEQVVEDLPRSHRRLGAAEPFDDGNLVHDPPAVRGLDVAA
jgi:hypothetical protein